MLCDKEIATEMLTVQNNLTSLYCTAVQEARTEPIHCDLKDMMNDAFKCQEDTIKMLQNKGLYKVSTVDSAKINKVKSEYDSAASN